MAVGGVGQLRNDIASRSNPPFACLPGSQRELAPFVLFLCKNVLPLLKRVRPQSIGFSRRQKGGKNSAAFTSICGSFGLFLTVVRPFKQKVASASQESVFALRQSDLDKHGGGLPGRFCLTQHRLTPHMESFCMATPGLAPCGGSLREAQACRRSLGLIGCWQWNAAGWILLTRAPSSTVTPLAALLKPPPQ